MIRAHSDPGHDSVPLARGCMVALWTASLAVAAALALLFALSGLTGG